MTAYCQQFGIGSRVASFLVLENENDYKRLNLEEERGKTVNGDLGLFLDEIVAAISARRRRPGKRSIAFLDRIEPTG